MATGILRLVVRARCREPQAVSGRVPGLGQVSSTFDREQIEMADGKAIEILCQTASASARVFLVPHRTWDMARRGRYVWRSVDGRWLIEQVEVIAETVKSRGFSVSFRAPSL
jgi:hypothetical protein